MKYSVFTVLMLLLLWSCGSGDERVDYTQKLTGEWKLVNIPDIMKAGQGLGNSAEDLRQSAIFFHSDGSMDVFLGASNQKGSWEVSDDGQWLSMKAKGLPFDEKLALAFENERTINILNNGRLFKFKKQSD